MPSSHTFDAVVIGAGHNGLVCAFYLARAGLKVINAHAFGPDYAETLRRWRANFNAKEAQVRELGFDQRFARIWEFYLCYCEAAFDMGNTNVVQYTLAHA